MTVEEINTYGNEAESKAVTDASNCIKCILDAKYEKANLDEYTSQCTNLNIEQCIKLNNTLKKFENLFDGTLGKWKTRPYTIELKDDAKPFYKNPYPIPCIHEQTFKKELDRLCEVGVLEPKTDSKWGSPTFIIPKKDNSVRFITDFRELNKRIKCKPFPIPQIQDLLLKLEGFKYATSLDLNMGYYHIELSPDSQCLCTIVTPWGKYSYKRLPMGLCNSPDIFQEKISELMWGLDFVCTYIDDLLVITKGTWEDHLEKLETVLNCLQEAGLKVNLCKSFFGKDQLEYLGYIITRDGIKPISSKVDAISKIAVPKNRKQLRKFIGIVNYYRNMWPHRSEVLAPLTKLSSPMTQFKWTEVEQKAFDTIKRIISRDTLLTYPDFNKPFILHTDASHEQLGVVISQDNKPIAFYSRKLTDTQKRYTMTEYELLSIVETFKEFRNILLGQKIIVYTDHQNLTYKNFNTECVM